MLYQSYTSNKLDQAIMIGYTVSQVGANRYGSGLHFVNVPHWWRIMHWHVSCVL